MEDNKLIWILGLCLVFSLGLNGMYVIESFDTTEPVTEESFIEIFYSCQNDSAGKFIVRDFVIMWENLQESNCTLTSKNRQG